MERIELRGDDVEDARAQLSDAVGGRSQPLATSPGEVGSPAVFLVLSGIDDLVLALCASLSEVAAELLARLSAIADEFRALDRRMGAQA